MNILSNKHNFEEFKDSLVWHDMQEWIKDMIENIRGELETVDDIKTMHRMQGEIITLRRMLALPDAMIEWFNYNNNQKEGGE